MEDNLSTTTTDNAHIVTHREVNFGRRPSRVRSRSPSSASEEGGRMMEDVDETETTTIVCWEQHIRQTHKQQLDEYFKRTETTASGGGGGPYVEVTYKEQLKFINSEINRIKQWIPHILWMPFNSRQFSFFTLTSFDEHNKKVIHIIMTPGVKLQAGEREKQCTLTQVDYPELFLNTKQSRYQLCEQILDTFAEFAYRCDKNGFDSVYDTDEEDL